MDISSVTAPSSLDTVAAIGVQHAAFSPAAPLVTDTVNISAAGKLLSASILFEAATNSTDFATVAVAVQYFVDAFNNFLQSDNLQSTTGGALNNPFMQVLNAGTNVFNLSATGFSMATGQITVDYNALQAAFTANPAGTVSQLAQATLSIGQLAAQFTTLAAQLNSLSQLPLASSPAGTPAQVTPTTATAATAAAPTTATTATATATTATTTTATTATATTATAVPTVTASLATAATTTAATTLQDNAVNRVSTTVNSADPAVAAAIASYRMTDGSFDMAKPHDTGPAPKTPSYSEITSIAPILPVMLNLHA